MTLAAVWADATVRPTRALQFANVVVFQLAWFAAVLGAAHGVSLGAARFVDARPALMMLAASWALALPLLMWLSMRFDGVAVPPEPAHA